jgi:hypothetical protein
VTVKDNDACVIHVSPTCFAGLLATDAGTDLRVVLVPVVVFCFCMVGIISSCANASGYVL